MARTTVAAPGPTPRTLPGRDEMLEAFMERDPAYEGVFYTGVRTTGIFCRPTCAARKPLPENVEFFPTARDALLAGYRACRRCRPLRPAGEPPAWLEELLADVREDPARSWRDADLEGRGLSPDRVRRWFQRQHGMTFHAYVRARRLGRALGRLRQGDEILATAFDSGYESASGFHEAFTRLFGAPPGEMRRENGAGAVTVSRLLTPLGPMLAGVADDRLCLLEFADRRALEKQLRLLRRRLDLPMVPGSHAVLARTADELEAWFEGELRHFSVPLADPGTEFQRRVWQALGQIPYGTTVSYGELARRIGRPSAVRAVAGAVGDNRLAVVVPCHRVVGSDGSLTGYGGGLWRKRRLLEIEQLHADGT